jgi:hypothetical protein
MHSLSPGSANRCDQFTRHPWRTSSPLRPCFTHTWFKAGTADGFNLMPDVLPGGLEVFVDTVVPILQRRGLFHKEYSGTTLRDHFGLPRPPSRFAKQTPAAASAYGYCSTLTR